jgi:membrane protease YdiL (CAAX protease family)
MVLATDSLTRIAAVLTFLLSVGAAGLALRKNFLPRWLLIAAGLVLVNDFLLARGYRLLPNLLPHTEWNWQGKVLALAATLVIASLPAFGWKRCGLTLIQSQGSLKICIPVALLYCLFFAAIAYFFPSGPASRETIAFQLTMPGLEEEAFYRGVLLFALDRAFAVRARFLGADWSWGAVLSCILFGLAHAFGYSHGHFTFDAMTMGLTAIPSFIAVWLRLRTGSIVLPVLLHNFGNAITLFF